MSVKNLECQIAKAQIGRYLAGDALSSEAVGQLEEHIAECDECQSRSERQASEPCWEERIRPPASI
jgi:hypothetical protein